MRISASLNLLHVIVEKFRNTASINNDISDRNLDLFCEFWNKKLQ